MTALFRLARQLAPAIEAWPHADGGIVLLLAWSVNGTSGETPVLCITPEEVRHALGY